MFKIKSVYINPTKIYPKIAEHCNLYRVYKNPEAKDLFIKAQNAKTVEERAKLFEEMGEYNLVTEPEKKSHRHRLIQFIRGLFNAC